MQPFLRVVRLLLIFMGCCAHYAVASAPALYSQPAYESPVRGDPDDLLLIPGYGLAAGDTVVYAAISDTTLPPTQPKSISSFSTQSAGTADLVSVTDAPYSLTVHLPAAMVPNQSYALWVVTPDGEWSAPLLINDARPIWITPDSAYQTAQLANLPRVLKVIGRNLQPDPNTQATTSIRLLGTNAGTIYTLTARPAKNDPGATTATLGRYVATADLPPNLTPDRYTVQVSRDGTSWVSLLGNGQSPPQTFDVEPDPGTKPTFAVSDPRFSDPVNGPCQPNDDIDDTACILLAIRAATLAGGGTVVFDPGVWVMSDPGVWAAGTGYSDRIGMLPGHCTAPTETCGVSFYGVLVPVGVDLQGAGPAGDTATEIKRGTGWLSGNGTALTGFTLQGKNNVSGIAFVDAIGYASGFVGQPELKLGLTWYFAHLYSPSDPVAVSNIVISNNLFVQPYRAIGTGSLPTDHVYITSNTFGGAYDTGIVLAQDGNDVHNLSPSPTPAYPYQPYQFSDSIIDYNTFYPSSNQQTAAAYSGAGSIATQINTSLRLDFSNNTADGTSRQYLYNPGADMSGWRAAHFWSTGVNQEMMLVSNNVVTCPGDKYGDGEAIAYDGSSDLGGMPLAEPVTAAAQWQDARGIAGTAVTVRGTIATTLQSGAPAVDISSNPSAYYRGYWAQIVQGAGKGQWRKVESVSLGSDSAGQTVTLNVAPAFDVPPDSTSKLILSRAYWQNVTVNNYVDQRAPTCTKANTRGGGSGGALTWYASTADSVMAGNQQYDTSGILLNHTYQPSQSSGIAAVVLQSANEVSDNLISGDYHWNNAGGSQGGIQLGYGATAYFCSGNTCPAPQPPDLGFGVSIAWNTIIQADATDSASGHLPVGAIGSRAVWNTGPIDASGMNEWNLGDATLVFHNTLQNISDTLPDSTPNVARVGIGFDIARGTTTNPPVSWRSALYANSCSTVDVPVSDFGLGLVRYCPATGSGTCECSGISNADVGITARRNHLSAAVGGSVTYSVSVINYDTANSASAVTLFVEPSAGVSLDGSTFTASAGACDGSTNVCKLGNLAAGQSVTVCVVGSLLESGKWPVTFSVSHREADNVPGNDGVTVVASVQ